VELDGTTDCRKVLGGRAEVEEMMSKAPTNACTSRGWHCVFTTRNPISGVFTGPMRPMESWSRIPWSDNLPTEEFYNQQVYEGRAIYARFIWSGVTTDSPHFEQAFSTDGGKTWETNWITDQTKEKP
jgi:hypothetical protein